MMKRLIGAGVSGRDLSQAERHACVNDCMVFPVQARRHWDADEACEKCGERRFKTVRVSRSKVKLIPRKPWYHFGLGNVITNTFFANKAWCRYRGKERDESNDGFFGSPEAQRLNDTLPPGRKLTDPDTSSYTLGADWGQMFQFKQHSCGIIGIHCNDIPERHRFKRCFSEVVTVIPGPKEPKNMSVYTEVCCLVVKFSLGNVCNYCSGVCTGAVQRGPLVRAIWTRATSHRNYKQWNTSFPAYSHHHSLQLRLTRDAQILLMPFICCIPWLLLLHDPLHSVSSAAGGI